MPPQSPFDPEQAQGGMVNGVATPAAGGQLADEWRSFASAPEGRAALIQAGIAMLQPRSPGQTALGQVANAVGQGGEAAQNVVSQREKEADSQSLRDYRKNTGEASQAKGEAALLNANTRELLGGRGATPTSIVAASMKAQGRAQNAIESLFPKAGGIDMDPMGESNPNYQALKSLDPRIKTKKDAAQLWGTDQDFRRKVVQLFKSDEVQRASSNYMLPEKTGATSSGRPTAMSEGEARSQGLYDHPLLVEGRAAYERDPSKASIILQRLKAQGINATIGDLKSGM